MGRCTGRRNLTEIPLKMALNANKSSEFEYDTEMIHVLLYSNDQVTMSLLFWGLITDTSTNTTLFMFVYKYNFVIDFIVWITSCRLFLPTAADFFFNQTEANYKISFTQTYINFSLNSLPNDKFLNRSKLNAFAEDKINATKKWKLL